MDQDWRESTTCGRAISTGQAVFVDDVSDRSLSSRRTATSLVDAGFRSLWAYPVIDSSTDRILGSFVIAVDRAPKTQPP